MSGPGYVEQVIRIADGDKVGASIANAMTQCLQWLLEQREEYDAELDALCSVGCAFAFDVGMALGTGGSCAYCFQHFGEDITAHIRKCPSHPMAALEKEAAKLRSDLKHRIPEFIHFGGTGEPETPEGKAALDKVARLLNQSDVERDLLRRAAFVMDVHNEDRPLVAEIRNALKVRR